MENKPTYTNCEYFINEDGMPYCAIKDLYTEARADCPCHKKQQDK